jgi:hypothetical protein
MAEMGIYKVRRDDDGIFNAGEEEKTLALIESDKNLGPFPDFTGKGRFAVANSYERPQRICLAIGHEHAR